MNERFLGEIITANRPRGFYFLAGPDGKSEFLHATRVLDRVVPAIGDLFFYSVRPSTNKPGQTEAYDAQLYRRAAKPVVQEVAPATNDAVDGVSI